MTIYNILSCALVLPGLLAVLYLLLFFNSLESLAISAIFGGPGFVVGFLFGLYKFVHSIAGIHDVSSALKNAFYAYAYATLGLLVSAVLFYGYLGFTKYLRN